MNQRQEVGRRWGSNSSVSATIPTFYKLEVQVTEYQDGDGGEQAEDMGGGG